MPESLQKWIEQSRGIWAGLGWGQRAALLGVLGASAVAFLVVGVWGQRPDFTTLYSRTAGRGSSSRQG
jgi:flagellar biosynthesis/type III secretory pathway M-ring protein FliF/YscJ